MRGRGGLEHSWSSLPPRPPPQAQNRCCPTAQPTWSWRPARTSGTELTSTLFRALTGSQWREQSAQAVCLPGSQTGGVPGALTSLPPCFPGRKKVLDFYQRACLSGYCSAFAYKPMSCSLSSQLNGKCIELVQAPGQSSIFTVCELPSTVPIKLNTRRNSWSSDGTVRARRGRAVGGLPEGLGIDGSRGDSGDSLGPGRPRWHSLSGAVGRRGPSSSHV